MSAPSGKLSLLHGGQTPIFRGQSGLSCGIRVDHHAATLEVLHVDVAGGGHRALEGADEVGLAVRLVARSEQHLFERAAIYIYFSETEIKKKPKSYIFEKYFAP